MDQCIISSGCDPASGTVTLSRCARERIEA